MFLFTMRFAVRYLFGGPMPEMPEFDPELALIEPVLREARDRARAGDWWAARKVVEDAGTDWDVRMWRLGTLAELAEKDDGWLYAWLRAEPSDPDAVLVQAMALHKRAWEARGGAS